MLFNGFSCLSKTCNLDEAVKVVQMLATILAGFINI